MPTDAPSPDTRQLAARCGQALDDKKAINLRLLDVRGRSTVTDYLLIASGNSQPHLKALRGAVERALKDAGATIIGAEAGDNSGWQVVDAFDLMIHLFTPETRTHYALEQLWKDAPEVDIGDTAST